MNENNKIWRVLYFKGLHSTVTIHSLLFPLFHIFKQVSDTRKLKDIDIPEDRQFALGGKYVIYIIDNYVNGR